VHATPVRLGLSNITATEIAHGLDESAVVVVGPATGLADGDKVNVVTQ